MNLRAAYPLGTVPKNRGQKGYDLRVIREHLRGHLNKPWGDRIEGISPMTA